MNKKNLMSLCT